MTLRVVEVLRPLAVRVHRGSASVEFESATADSRRVQPGAVFVAVRGHAADGHDHAPAAVRAGAVAVVAERPLDLSTNVLVVDDPRVALGLLVRAAWGQPDRALQIVAITGTNGKTTVSHLVRDLLEAVGRACGLIGTIRYETMRRSIPAPLTTPGPEQLMELLSEIRDAGAGAVAMEASSHALDQRRLAGIEVDVAAYTNLTREHLDYHATLEEYLGAKRRLLDHLAQDGRQKPRGMAVVNVDDPVLAAAEWPASSTLRVGRDARADLRLLDASCTRDGTRLVVRDASGEATLESRLLGTFNVENLLVTAGVGRALGLELAELTGAFAALRPVRGRLEPVELQGGPLALVDYAHTPDGLRSALRAVRGLTKGRLTVVFGCGGDRDRGKRPLMAQAVIEGADRAILTLDNPRTEDPQRIFADAETGFAADPSRARRIEDRGDAIAAALADATVDDVVVVAGKGHETYQIVGQTKHPWDDRQALLDAWTARGGGA